MSKSTNQQNKGTNLQYQVFVTIRVVHHNEEYENNLNLFLDIFCFVFFTSMIMISTKVPRHG